MRPMRNTMTPLRFSILGIRLVVLLLLVNCVYYAANLMYTLAHAHEMGRAAGTYAAMLLAYVIAAFALLRYPDWFARTLSRNLPVFVAVSRWSRVELVAAILAGVAAFEVISAIPSFFQQLYSILERYLDYTASGVSDTERFNAITVGFIGASLRICVAGIVFLKSGRLATYWDRRQSADGLRGTRGRVRD